MERGVGSRVLAPGGGGFPDANRSPKASVYVSTIDHNRLEIVCDRGEISGEIQFQGHVQPREISSKGSAALI